MEQYRVKVQATGKVTHDVLRIITGKPLGFYFTPGQATEVAINKSGWENKRRPFTFTCLPEDNYLEFMIKTYPLHKGVTQELLQLRPGDELILHDVFGAISYKGEGVFIAGGAGVTPFISIFRLLRSKNEVGSNKLLFANKKKEDIMLEQEFKQLLGENFISILSEEKVDGYAHGYINEEFLKAHIPDLNKKIYLCGPEPMVAAVEKQLYGLGVQDQSIIKEQF